MTQTIESPLEYGLTDENIGLGSKRYMLYLIPIKKHIQSLDLSFYLLALHSKAQRATT